MLIVKIAQAVCRKFVRQLHRAEHVAHCTYLGSVAWFATGPYAYAAAGLLIVVVLLGLAETE